MPHRPATARLLRVIAVLVLATIAVGCKSHGIATTPYGTLDDGSTAHTYTLTNDNGVTAVLTDFGATLVALHVPDRDGNLADVTLGYDTLDGWVNDGSYMGATAGRYANRIAGGAFTIDGETYQLATNNGDHHLHGGDVGFNKRLWDAQPFDKDGKQGVMFTYTSPAGEEGYPGELTCWVTYTLTQDNELRIDFKAKTTQATPINLVHHSYWNLTGEVSNTILDHQLVLHADYYCPTDAGGIPNGDPALSGNTAPNGLSRVQNTPFDFRTAHAIGERIDGDHEQLVNGKGYDHSWAVNGESGTLRIAAELFDPTTGRVMEIWTDQPAIQFYTGNYLDGAPGKNGGPMNYRTGLCLETQAFPDSPNQPDLSNGILRPGDIYHHVMVHKFSVR
ncbi:galactose mutarotase [Phycisphaeraceae bacterium D3-23]